MRIYRDAPDRLQFVYRLFAGWYLIWFLVGLFFVGLNLPSLFGPIEDFFFMFLAGVVLLLDAIRRMGWLAAVVGFLWIAVVSGAVETIGAVTGFPFGTYQYTQNFGPRLFGILPLAIPFAWWAILLPLQIIFLRLSQRNWVPVSIIPVLVGLSAAIIDLALEPIATLQRGYWSWEGDGLWYGVPWTNFLGWFATAAILSAGLQLLIWPAMKRSYGWEYPSAHMLPVTVLLSIVVTFLIASLLASYWLASLVAVIVTVVLCRSLKTAGVISLQALRGRL